MTTQERAATLVKEWVGNPGIAGEPDLQARIESALREYGDERENEGLERAAKMAEQHASVTKPLGVNCVLHHDIRALKSERLSVGKGE